MKEKNGNKQEIINQQKEDIHFDLQQTKKQVEIMESSIDERKSDEKLEDFIIKEEKINLQNIFAPYLTLTTTQASKLYIYNNFLIKNNKKVNLTAITDGYEIAVKHFLDSALGAQFIPLNAELCDIGSGAGFPAVVLKIIRDDLKVTLVDSIAKKVDFLRRLCQILKIEAQRFIARAENLALTRRETFSCVTARAVASLPTLLEYCAPLVKLGGIFLAYKGREAEAEILQAITAAEVLGMEIASKNDFILPNEDFRTIIVYKKIRETPQKYPRAQNLPKKKPIM